jgi:hypothetical protein
VTRSTRPDHEGTADLFDEIRAASAFVAERARSVRIDDARLVAYARELPQGEIRTPPPLELPANATSPEARAAFVLALDAVNFGSGYFPQLHKREGLSGYRTVHARLREWFERDGPPAPAMLAALDASACGRIFDQPLDDPARAELMGLFARALRDLGDFVSRFAPDRSAPEQAFRASVEAAGGSAVRLVESLLVMPLYRDVSRYDGREVPFLKRAQITAQDLALAGVVFPDLDRLTLFADNLVPHVLRLDGVLRFDPGLVERIEAGRLLEPGSREEVEIRACALHAVERLARAGPAPRLLDMWLWERGSRPEYKARPRHRCRCPYY